MLLMEKWKHLLWSPCATHCIDLMLEDIASMKQIKETLDQAKMITRFIYNSLKVVNLMKVFTKDKDLLRPGITRFATKFISLKSLIRNVFIIRPVIESEKLPVHGSLVGPAVGPVTS
ncbi:hypothetical protein CK203_090456 [Vitis vinifera]|uniref:DUF659 domain-containing protein n=1 Tax=Vitis vinifera TaxID=29760 RepID=A0A438BVY0_VITVI|nr:hypothetical protein CK203_090456 [Vitis vinifera]